MNTKAFRNLSYGLYIISTMDGERATCCTANSVMQITSQPATMALSLNHDNYTNGCVKKCGYFSVSILSEESDPSLIGRFGFQSGKDVNKYEGIDFQVKEGVPVIPDSCGYIVCKVIDQMETSTHTVFLGEVIDADVFDAVPEMTYAYYHKVVKGKAPKNAPTYLPEEDGHEEAKDVWVCSVCGYEYDGTIAFEELPEDYTCPLCNASKDKFKKKS